MIEEYKWNIKRKNFAGELYDLTASSTLGLKGFETGKLKNTQALNHGISETLEKYSNELDIILKDEEDDKFYKRKDIYNLLDYCISIDIQIKKLNELIKNVEVILNYELIMFASFDKLFQFTMNYLNGGDGSSQYNNQPLIVTIAGGNALKIFFAILTFLHNLNTGVNFDVFIEKYYSKIKTNETQKSLLKEILINLKSLFNYQLLENDKLNMDTKERECVNEIELNLDMLINELNNYIIKYLINNSTNLICLFN